MGEQGKQTRKIFTVLEEKDFFKSEKDRIIRRVLMLFENETNYRDLSLEKRNKIRNIVLDEINNFYRLSLVENDKMDR